jgi:hypothetical protein
MTALQLVDALRVDIESDDGKVLRQMDRQGQANITKADNRDFS